MTQKKAAGLLKISEVAALADTSVSTVKYYVKEGLVDIACKTGKNMAYYKPESVERVKLIKTLQNEKYYPLSVIKRIISSGGVDRSEDELLYTISKADEADYYELIPLTEAAREAGLKAHEVEAAVKAGLVVPSCSGRSRQCTRGELRVMKLIKKRLDAKIPLEQTVKTFSMFQARLSESARMDVESLVSEGMPQKNLSTEDIVRIINISDETLDSFISMKRYAINAAIGAQYIAKTEEMLKKLRIFTSKLSPLLDDGERQALLTAAAGGKDVSPALNMLGGILALSGTGIAKSLSTLYAANECFSQNEPQNRLDWAVCAAWKSLVPREFGFSEQLPGQPVGCGEFFASVLRLTVELQNEI